MTARIRWGTILGLAMVVVACSGVTAPPAGSPTAAETHMRSPSMTPTDRSLPSMPANVDGESWIVYQKDGLWLVRSDGTEAHLLTGDMPAGAAHPDWSHDGKRLTFIADEADTRDIWVADLDGSRATRVFDCVAPCVDADGPAWSPDDRQIAFRTFDLVDGEFSGSTLKVLDVNSGSVTNVASTTAPEFIGNGTSVRWSPDGRTIVMDIATIQDPGTDQETVTSTAIATFELGDPPTALHSIAGLVAMPSYVDWHPTQDLLVFMAPTPDAMDPGREHFDLYTVASDGSGLTQLTRFGPDRSAWGPMGARWSIDPRHGPWGRMDPRADPVGRKQHGSHPGRDPRCASAGTACSVDRS